MMLFAAVVQAQVEHVDDSNFDATIAKGWVIVDFSADWCGPCKRFAPTFEEVSDSYNGKVLFAKFDETKPTAVGERLWIKSLPTIILFKDGKEVNRFSALKQKNDFIAWVNQSVK